VTGLGNRKKTLAYEPSVEKFRPRLFSGNVIGQTSTVHSVPEEMYLGGNLLGLKRLGK
jgi:hypothetical protein